MWRRKDKKLAEENPPRTSNRAKDSGLVRRSSRRRGLRGQIARQACKEDAAGDKQGEERTMSSAHDSSSEATKSDDEAIATCMMNLTIACNYLAQQCSSEPPATGNWHHAFCFGIRV